MSTLDPTRELRCEVLRCSGLTGAICARRHAARSGVCAKCSIGAAFANAEVMTIESAVQIIRERTVDSRTRLTMAHVPAGLALVYETVGG